MYSSLKVLILSKSLFKFKSKITISVSEVNFLFSLSGDNECGKTTLIAKLQGVEDPKKGAGLEYYYIDVRDEYRDGKLKANLNNCPIHLIMKLVCFPFFFFFFQM